MPLPLLGALVVCGIGGLVLLIHLFGWTRRPQFADAAAARAAFLTDYPDADIRQTLLAADRRAALFDLGDEIGFAAPFGDGRLTRRLGSGDVKTVGAPGDQIVLRLTDYTAPYLKIALAAADHPAWIARLDQLRART